MEQLPLDLRMDFHQPPGDGWTWYSVCSRHGNTNESIDVNCSACMSGRWLNDEEQALDHKLHDEDYAAWYKKHNAPDSDSHVFLKKIFPNLS